jgi:hypothetical protein
MSTDEHPLGYHTDADPEAFRTIRATWHASVQGAHVYLWRSPGPDGPTVSAVHGFSPNTGGRITSAAKLSAYKAGEGLRLPIGAQQALLRALADAHPDKLDTTDDPPPVSQPQPLDLGVMAEAEATITRQTGRVDSLLRLAISQAETIQAMEGELRVLRRRADTPNRIDFQHPEPAPGTTFGRTATWRGPTSA